MSGTNTNYINGLPVELLIWIVDILAPDDYESIVDLAAALYGHTYSVVVLRRLNTLLDNTVHYGVEENRMFQVYQHAAARKRIPHLFVDFLRKRLSDSFGGHGMAPVMYAHMVISGNTGADVYLHAIDTGAEDLARAADVFIQADHVEGLRTILPRLHVPGYVQMLKRALKFKSINVLQYLSSRGHRLCASCAMAIVLTLRDRVFIRRVLKALAISLREEGETVYTFDKEKMFGSDKRGKAMWNKATREALLEVILQRHTLDLKKRTVKAMVAVAIHKVQTKNELVEVMAVFSVLEPTSDFHQQQSMLLNRAWRLGYVYDMWNDLSSLAGARKRKLRSEPPSKEIVAARCEGRRTAVMARDPIAKFWYTFRKTGQLPDLPAGATLESICNSNVLMTTPPQKRTVLLSCILERNYQDMFFRLHKQYRWFRECVSRHLTEDMMKHIWENWQPRVATLVHVQYAKEARYDRDPDVWKVQPYGFGDYHSFHVVPTYVVNAAIPLPEPSDATDHLDPRYMCLGYVGDTTEIRNQRDAARAGQIIAQVREGPGGLNESGLTMIMRNIAKHSKTPELCYTTFIRYMAPETMDKDTRTLFLFGAFRVACVLSLTNAASYIMQIIEPSMQEHLVNQVSSELRRMFVPVTQQRNWREALFGIKMKHDRDIAERHQCLLKDPRDPVRNITERRLISDVCSHRKELQLRLHPVDFDKDAPVIEHCAITFDERFFADSEKMDLVCTPVV